MKSLPVEQLAIVKNIRDASYDEAIKNVELYAVSGDDLYVVVQESSDKYVYLKLLCDSGDDKDFSHEIADKQEFPTRGQACVYLSQKLLEEETGYAE